MYLVIKSYFINDDVRVAGIYSNLTRAKRDVLREMRNNEDYQIHYEVMRIRVNQVYNTCRSVAVAEWVDANNSERRPVWVNITEEDGEEVSHRVGSPKEKYPPGISNRERLAYDLFNKDKIAMDLCRDVLGLQDMKE